jgi:dinuclear metal center YbgI/SA1388 family protein
VATSTDPQSTRQDLQSHLEALLQPARFKDYCPNGLQVEGRERIRKLVTGVTASQALIDAAAEAGADALLVHHGLFWRGQDGRVTGWMKKRLQALMQAGINLFAFHLPLDAHPELGNNAQLGQRLGLRADAQRFGDDELGWLGEPEDGQAFAGCEALARHIESRLNRSVIVVGSPQAAIKKVAWCTGGAQGWFEAAVAAGAEAFITGEISEPQAHLARECGVAFLACGHHATERYGVQAVGAHLAQRFGLEHQFIDIDNPA